MKKLYSMMMLAIIAMCASFTAKADVFTTTITWDTPGSVVLYFGGTGESNKLDVPADVTSYTYTTESTWKTMYIAAAEGYILEGATCEDGTEFKPSSYNSMSSFVVKAYDGKTINVKCAKIEYDGSFTINFVSAGTVNATLSNPKRDFNLEGGEQKLPILTKYNNTLSLSAKAELASNYYVKKNGEDVEWVDFYGTLKLSELSVADGDVIEVKYNDEPAIIASEQTKYTVTVNYADQVAKNALSSIFNKTKFESINSVDQFEVVEGTLVQFSFNTFDYTVTINGEQLPGGTQVDKYRTWSTTVNANTTISVSAKERDYGTTSISFMIDKPECLVVRDGTIDGPVIDLSQYTPTSTTLGGVSYKLYTVKANAKYGKLFVLPAENCWFEKCVYDSDGEEAESGVVMSDYSNFRIIASPIVRDQLLVVYLDSSCAPSKVNLADAQGNKFTLEKGYNEFQIDPKYSNPMRISPVDATNFHALSDYIALAADENGVYYADLHAGGQVMHIYDKNTPAVRTITVKESGVTGTTVTIDHITYTVEEGKTFSALNNFDVTVKPGEGASKVLNGETEAELTDGVYTFKPTADVEITVEAGNPTEMVITPAADSVAEEFESILISFPSAKTVEQALDDDELVFGNNGWANYGWTIAKVEAEQGVAFTATPNFHTPNGTFRLYMPEGFFLIDGQYNSEEVDMNFTVKRPVSDFSYVFSPETDTMITSEWGINVAIAFNEEYQVAIANQAGVKVTLDGTDVTSQCMVMTEECYFMVCYPVGNAVGKLALSIAEGALTLSGAAVPAISREWNVIEPREYTADAEENWTGDQNLSKDSDFEVIISFTGADSAELFHQAGISLYEMDYNAANRYNEVATSVEAVTPEIQTYATAGATPTFKLTFPSLYSVKGDSYDYSKPVDLKLNVEDGAFTLDGNAPSPAIEKEYRSFLTTGIANINVTLDGEARYYNLQGVEVKNPAEGQVYIKVIGKKAAKVQL
ncbi:MAG: hypothetical protein K2N91_09165 [Muribaculaceae bacterium]|nr:hypothetical protein [Muribaculaceae bacterium]